MTSVGTEDAVASYLTSLRAALADLPPSEVEEILDEVGPHVAEVAGELGEEDLPGRLIQRLGEPEEYAAELRAAAGYPPRPADVPGPPDGRQPRRGGLRLALWLLVAAIVLGPLFVAFFGPGSIIVGLLLSTVLAGLSLAIVLRSDGGLARFAALPEVRWLWARNPGGPVAEYARLLQPGWWLVRAGIAAVLVVAAFGAHPIGLWVGLLTVPLAVGSVWIGRRSQADRRWLWVVLPLNAFAVFIGLVLLDRVSTTGAVIYTNVEGPIGVPMRVPAFSNVFPFDSNGRPLTGVYLYDEDGRPITPLIPASNCTPRDRIPVPANQYPQPVYQYDETTGTCVTLSTVPTPSSLPTPTPTPTG